MAGGIRRGVRKGSSLMELALEGHWSVAAFLATVMALAGMVIVPALSRSNSVLVPLSASLKPVVWGLCGFFALTALIKFRLEMRAESRRRLKEYLARDEAIAQVYAPELQEIPVTAVED